MNKKGKLVVFICIAVILTTLLIYSSKKSNKAANTPEVRDKSTYYMTILSGYNGRLLSLNQESDNFIQLLIDDKKPSDEVVTNTLDKIKNINNDLIEYISVFIPKMESPQFQSALKSIITFNNKRIEMLEAMKNEYNKDKKLTMDKASEIYQQYFEQISKEDMQALQFLESLDFNR